MWSAERLTKIQATLRPENLWPEVWTKIGKTAQNREKQEWTIEKPKLDDARRLRSIYFIDPEDGAYKETVENARRKLEVPLDAALPCKKGRFLKTKHACIVDTHESTRQRLESSAPKDHEDHIAGKGYYSMTHYNLVHKFIPIFSSDENSGCESSSEQGMEEARNDSSVAVGESQKQERRYSGSTKRQKKVHFATLMDTCHLKKVRS